MLVNLKVDYIAFPHGIDSSNDMLPHTHLWETLDVSRLNFTNDEKRVYIRKMPVKHLTALIKQPEGMSCHIHGAENLTAEEHHHWYSFNAHKTRVLQYRSLLIAGILMTSTGLLSIISGF